MDCVFASWNGGVYGFLCVFFCGSVYLGNCLLVICMCVCVSVCVCLFMGVSVYVCVCVGRCFSGCFCQMLCEYLSV